ncbi:AAA family ATPase, partial [Vibrio lentus]
MVPNEWKRVNLDKLLATSVRNGYSPNAVDHETGHVVLGLGALTDRALDLANVKNVEATEQVLKTQLSHGDFLISRSNTPDKVGRSAMFRGELESCSYPDLMMKFRLDESIADPQYIESYLQSTKMRQYFRSCAAGSSNSMVKITKSVVEKAPILIPELAEQRKIVEILSTWDKAISTTEKLIETSKQQKKSLMQQLLTGKKRLVNPETDKAFEGEWKKVELGKLLDYKQPTPYLVKSTEYSNEYLTPVLTAGKTFILGYSNEDFGIFREELPAIIFDDFTTASKFVDFPFKAKSSAMKILIAKDSVSIKYVYEAMQVLNYPVGGHQRHWISIFVNLVIGLPEPEEQQKISSVLTAADKEIEVLQAKLAHFNQEKKALMQQLLTGKVRSQYERDSIDDMKFEPIIKLNKLVVKNYRRLEDLTIRLSDSNINVFIGNNGTGKTSILESIALSLSWLVARIKTSNGNGGVIGQSDITVNKSNATIGLSTEVIFDSSRQNYLWNTSVSRNGFTNKDESEYTQLKYLTEKIRNSITIDETTSIPLVVYYGVDRTNVNVKFSSLKSKYDRFDAFDFPIYKGASINGVFDWFHYRENIQNEKNIGNSGASNLEALLKSQGLSSEKISEALR